MIITILIAISTIIRGAVVFYPNPLDLGQGSPESVELFNCENRPFGDLGFRFDNLILRYFRTHFGSGGTEYLRRFNTKISDSGSVTGLCPWASTLGEGAIKLALEKEMKAIVYGQRGFLSWGIISKKKTDDPRY